MLAKPSLLLSYKTAAKENNVQFDNCDGDLFLT